MDEDDRGIGHWGDDGEFSPHNNCIRCDKEIKGDELSFRMLYCWHCRREGSRNSGLVGPIFGYGGW